jgi:Uncharacterized protein conserved in bacteria
LKAALSDERKLQRESLVGSWKTADDLYTCTRGLWRLSRERAEHAKYAFAISKSEIKEVYEIEER